MARKCVRRRRVYSPVLGRNVLRCASFSGDGGLFGIFDKFPLPIEQIKGAFITGGLAVGGAVGARKVVSYVAPMLKMDDKPKVVMLLEIATGVILGVVVGKYMGKPEIGMALGVGPVVLNGIALVAEYMPELAAPGIAGLGVLVDRENWVPESMFQHGVTPQLQQQAEPAWTM